jgi:HSP20 family protein
MEKIHTTYIRQLQGCLGELTYELRIQYLAAARERSWTPAINAYHCGSHIVVCVELAGVDREQIELHAEPRRLLIRGVRAPLESITGQSPPLQIFALEIDQGTFQREIALPIEIVPDEVRAEQRNGLLWIELPLRS